MVSRVRELMKGKHVADDRKHVICNIVKLARDISSKGGQEESLHELSGIAYEILKLIGEEDNILYYDDILYYVDHAKYEGRENLWIDGVDFMYKIEIEPDADRCENVKYYEFPII